MDTEAGSMFVLVHNSCFMLTIALVTEWVVFVHVTSGSGMRMCAQASAPQICWILRIRIDCVPMESNVLELV